MYYEKPPAKMGILVKTACTNVFCLETIVLNCWWIFMRFFFLNEWKRLQNIEDKIQDWKNRETERSKIGRSFHCDFCVSESGWMLNKLVIRWSPGISTHAFNESTQVLGQKTWLLEWSSKWGSEARMHFSPDSMDSLATGSLLFCAALALVLTLVICLGGLRGRAGSALLVVLLFS